MTPKGNLSVTPKTVLSCHQADVMSFSAKNRLFSPLRNSDRRIGENRDTSEDSMHPPFAVNSIENS
jgi:hypothetical protein